MLTTTRGRSVLFGRSGAAIDPTLGEHRASLRLAGFADNKFTESRTSRRSASTSVQNTAPVDGKTIKLQIWDTAGQERFRTITVAYYRGTDGVIMVYDIAAVFDHVASGLAEVNKHAEDCKLIIGNKTNAPGRAVTTEEAREHADGLGVPFLETSARPTNVEEALRRSRRNY